jgi:hypothetical protein
MRRDRGTSYTYEQSSSAAIRGRIAAEMGMGRSLRSIAQELDAEQVPTAKGGAWYASTVAHVSR